MLSASEAVVLEKWGGPPGRGPAASERSTKEQIYTQNVRERRW